jgi:hypothetical protein
LGKQNSLVSNVSDFDRATEGAGAVIATREMRAGRIRQLAKIAAPLLDIICAQELAVGVFLQAGVECRGVGVIVRVIDFRGAAPKKVVTALVSEPDARKPFSDDWIRIRDLDRGYGQNVNKNSVHDITSSLAQSCTGC